jgi:four helix bundle protein
MKTKFKCHEKAVVIYRECKTLPLHHTIKNQLLRASSSIALNLNEGNSRFTKKDKCRFFNYAYSSAKEVKSICELEDLHSLAEKVDEVAKMIFVLIRYWR